MKFFKICLTVILFTFTTHLMAQMPGGRGQMGGAAMNVGHFYGKVVDSVTGKGVPFAAVQLTGPKWDSISPWMRSFLIVEVELVDLSGMDPMQRKLKLTIRHGLLNKM